VPVEGTQFLKALLSGYASLESPPLYTEADEVAKLLPSERIVSRLYVLKNTFAHGAMPAYIALANLINKARGHNILLFQQANAILLTSSITNILRAEKIIAGLDTKNDVMFFKLKHIRASELKRLLASLRTGGSPIMWFLAGDLTFEADDLANQLMVSTLPANRERLEKIIAELDKPNVVMKIFPVKNTRASDIKKLVAALQADFGGAIAPGGKPAVPGGAITRNPLRNIMAGDFVLEADDGANQIFVITQPENLPKIEEILAQLDQNKMELRFYEIKHLRATDMQKIIQTLQTGQSAATGGTAVPRYGAPNAATANKDVFRNLLGGDFVIEANRMANRLMVIAQPEVQTKIAEIIKEMDKNTSELMVFKVKHLKASKVKKLLDALRTGRSSDEVTGGAYNPNLARTNNTDLDSVRNLLGGDVALDADDFANQLIVVAQPQIREKIRALIGQIDTDSAPQTVSEIVGLKHSEVENTVRALSVIVTGKSGGLLQVEGGNRNNNSGRTGGMKGVTTTVNTYRTFSFTNRADSAAAPANLPQWQRNIVSAAGTPNSFSEYVTVSGDERTNRLMLFGTADDLRQLKEIIAKLDFPLPQVRIEAVVVEVTLSNGESSGLQTLGIGVSAGGAGYKYTRPAWNGSTAAPVTPGTSASPFSGSLVLAPDSFDLSLLLGEASRNSRVRILSAPLINTSHNQPATVFVGEEHPVITSSMSDLSNTTSTRSTVEFKQIGLELSVTPRVGADGAVEMKVDQTNQSIARSVVIDGNEQPVTATRSASAYLIAKDNETVVLAGLQSYREVDTVGAMWLLGKIPLLGRLFQPATNESARTEIIIFLRPHVLSLADAAADALPGMRHGALTRPEAKSYLDTGRFSAISLTEVERESISEIRRRQREDADVARAADAKDAAGSAAASEGAGL